MSPRGFSVKYVTNIKYSIQYLYKVISNSLTQISCIYCYISGLEIVTNTVANATSFSLWQLKFSFSRHFGDLNFA